MESITTASPIHPDGRRSSRSLVARLAGAAVLGALVVSASAVVAAPAAQADTGPSSRAPVTVPVVARADQVRVVVELSALAAGPAVEQALRALPSTTTVHPYANFPMLATETGAEGLRLLAGLPGVVSVTEDELLAPLDKGDEAVTSRAIAPPALKPTASTQAAPSYGGYQGWQRDVTRLGVARQKGWTGSGTYVAVIDTGVQSNHPELKGRIASPACFNLYNRTCPGGTSSRTGSGSAEPCTASGCSHGTHVAGIVGGKNVGAASATGIVPIQVFHPETSSCDRKKEQVPCARSWNADMMAALDWVVSMRKANWNVVAANISVGGGGFTGYCDNSQTDENQTRYFYNAVKDAKTYGVMTVVASGNNSYTNGVSSPACLSNVVSVGNSALTADNRYETVNFWSNSAVNSNTADLLNVLAPGTNIYSSVPGSGYGYMTGTSMAAPMVAGTIALLKQVKPGATWSELYKALTISHVSLKDPKNNAVDRRLDVWDSLYKAGAR